MLQPKLQATLAEPKLQFWERLTCVFSLVTFSYVIIGNRVREGA